ncbi:CDP-glucose 4,6-dehydratase [Sediminispirochaeta bajacaliforniensis]|uniref:CDP-glucose 4,6-dehydratase n=1 Tax=Sediminispirochaeta bajacaliforniensis TaxID=148 RepID=UPI0003757DA2|nr:CDP-glucose 4,6-dehydratase [Sediminispirochaeta bajacaliforniensis]
MVDQNFWKGKKVFVTGHTGFKGSWLTQWLLLLGATVKGFSLEPETNPALFSILQLTEHMMHTIGDIRDGEALKKSLVSFQPDIVFHLAAQPLVRRSYKEPHLTYETNVMGTLNLYEAVRSCDTVRSVVSITTDKCYENREWVWGYRESDPMGGYDPYSSSKGCVELLSSAYRHSFFNVADYGKTHQVGLATARAGNVIGGGDWAEDRLIPDCIRSLSTGKDIVIRNPRATRPWQHVLEPLSGYLLLAQKLWDEPQQYDGGWNFGPGSAGALSVSEVVSLVVSSWGTGGWRVEGDDGPHEAKLLGLDISKAMSILGWKPHLSTSEAIELTCRWYRLSFDEPDSIIPYTKNQITVFHGEGKSNHE